MARKKISELTTATDLVGDETLPLNQSGITKKTTVNALLAAGAGLSITEKSDAYTTTIDDANKGIANPNGNGSNVYSIPAESSVDYEVGTFITFINRDDVDTVVVLVEVDTLINSNTGASGSITINPRGMLTCLKTASGEWTGAGSNIE